MENRDQYIVEAKVVTTGEESVKKATKAVKKLTEAEKELAREAKKADDAQKAQKKALEKGVGAIDRMTGGLIGTFKSVKQGVLDAIPALKGMKGAIAATGIGLLVVAAGLLVQHWEKISGFFTSASSGTRDMVENAQAMADSAEAQMNHISASENILRLQGKSEEDILKMRIRATDESITAQKNVIDTLKIQKEEQIKSTQAAKEFTQVLVGFISLPITMALGMLDLLTAGLAELGLMDATNFVDSYTGSVAEMIFDPDEVAEEGDAAIAEAEKKLLELENQRAGHTLTMRSNEQAEADRAAVDKKNREDKEAQAKEKADADELARKKALAAAEARIEKALFDQSSTDIEKQVRAVEDKYNALEILAEQHGLSTVELELARQAAIAEIEEQARQARIDAEKAANEELEQADNDATAKQIENRHKVINTTIGQLQQGAKFAMDLLMSQEAADESSAKRRFEKAKKIQLSSAIMSTASAVIAALAAPPVGLGFPAGLGGAAMAALSGAGQIATIKRSTFDGGSSGGSAPSSSFSGAVGNAGGGQAMVDLSFMDQGSVDENPVRAYVLEQQVTSSQQSTQLIKEQAQL